MLVYSLLLSLACTPSQSGPAGENPAGSWGSAEEDGDPLDGRWWRWSPLDAGWPESEEPRAACWRVLSEPDPGDIAQHTQASDGTWHSLGWTVRAEVVYTNGEAYPDVTYENVTIWYEDPSQPAWIHVTAGVGQQTGLDERFLVEGNGPVFYHRARWTEHQDSGINRYEEYKWIAPQYAGDVEVVPASCE